MIHSIGGKHPAMAAANRGETYLFIDGNYLQLCCHEAAMTVLGETAALPSVYAIKQRYQASKVFYYDSVDDRPTKRKRIVDGEVREVRETQGEAAARSERLSLFLDETDRLDDVHVVFGSVTGRDCRRRQKEVDVKLAGRLRRDVDAHHSRDQDHNVHLDRSSIILARR